MLLLICYSSKQPLSCDQPIPGPCKCSPTLRTWRQNVPRRGKVFFSQYIDLVTEYRYQ